MVAPLWAWARAWLRVRGVRGGARGGCGRGGLVSSLDWTLLGKKLRGINGSADCGRQKWKGKRSPDAFSKVLFRCLES